MDIVEQVIEHGGSIRANAKKFGIPVSEWLDLSTGINPNAWPVPALPKDCWQRLPETNDGLEESIVSYYGMAGLPVAGSQVAIQWLPHLRDRLFGRGRVGVIFPSYAEHACRWKMAGHEIIELDPEEIEQSIDTLDALILINPNNPTGHLWSPDTLLKWHNRLHARKGWLIVDEAFIDITPENSVVNEAHREGLIVLRSLGKFFGLAGVRFGVMFAHDHLLRLLERELGPWHISGPARYIAQLALKDHKWQQDMRKKLSGDTIRLQKYLRNIGLVSSGNTGLFQWVKTMNASAIAELLAHQGILVRLFTQPTSIRFGLPGECSEWQRLESALNNIMGRDELGKNTA